MRENLQEEVQNERVLTSLVANHVGVEIIGLLLTFYRMLKMFKDKITHKTKNFNRKPALDQQSN